MKFLQFLFSAILFCVCLGCSRDPNVIKQKYLEGGNRYFERGRYREATIMYRRAVQVDPRFGQAYYRYSLALHEMQQFAESGRQLRRAVELLPEGAERQDARIRLARVLVFYLDLGAWHRLTGDEVLRIADEILEHDPKSFDAHLFEGKIRLLRAKQQTYLNQDALRDLEEGIAALERADRAKPHQTEALVPLALAIAKQGRVADAVALLTKHTGHAEAGPPAFQELAQIHLKQNQTAEAERVLRAAIERFPEMFEFRMSLMRLYMLLRRVEDLRREVAGMVSEHKRFPTIFETAGPLFVTMGLGEEALGLYDTAVSLRPAQANRFRVLKVDTLKAMQRIADARSANKAILDGNPDYEEALIREAAFELDEGNSGTAERILERIVVLHPQNHLAQFNLGRALAFSGKDGLARQRLTEAIRLAPAFIPARLELGRLEIRAGEHGRAVRTAEEILEQEPSNVEAEMLRASALRLAGKLEDADRVISRTAAKRQSLMLELCELRYAQGRVREAETACRESYLRNKSDLRGLALLVEARLRAGKDGEAIAMVERELAGSPQDLGLRVLLGETATRASRYGLAIATYQEALGRTVAQSPQYAEILIRMGELQRLAGDLKTAIGTLREAYKLAPQNPFAMQNLAVALDMSGDHAAAIALYEKSLSLFDRNPVVLNNLAFHLAETGGNLDRALTFAQRALQANPGFGEYEDTIGWIYLKKGLVREALDEFRKLVERNPAHPGYRYHLGAAYAQRGDRDAALRELEKALQLKPGAEDSAAIRALIARLKAS